MQSVPRIVIHHSRNLWNLVDLQGSVSQFKWQAVAVAAAYKMFGEGGGVIEVYDGHGKLLESIDLQTHRPSHR
jgi:hypothetical protein